MAEAAWEPNKSFPIPRVEIFGGAVLIFAFTSNSFAKEGKTSGASDLNKFSLKLIESADGDGSGGGLLLSKKSSILGKLGDGFHFFQIFFFFEKYLTLKLFRFGNYLTLKLSRSWYYLTLKLTDSKIIQILTLSDLETI